VSPACGQAARPPAPPLKYRARKSVVTGAKYIANRMDSIRILLADDHNILREGLRSLLDRQPGMCVVGEAADGRETVTLADEHHPDVIVMDIGMPNLNGIEATRRI